MELSLPSSRFKKSYIEAQREFRQENLDRDIDFTQLKSRFDYYVQLKLLQRQGKCLPPGFVPITEFWAVDKKHFLGRVVLRHHLNEALEKFGGHIGYEIRPSERQKGYGKQALALVLPEAKKIGLSKVLITCDDNNLGSIKIIESNGGLLQDRLQMEGRVTLTRRYWIEL
jgi:predicted acetyltransferase